MLTLRLQRTGRTGHAQFRLVAQDKRFSPLSGRVTAYLGNYDPHTKAAQLDSQKIAEYLEKGAQPSPRVVKLLKAEGIKLPKWVAEPAAKKKSTRSPEKLRKNRPAEPKQEVAAEPKAEELAEAPAEETPAEPETAAEADEEKPAEPEAEKSEQNEAPSEEKPEEPPAEPPAEDKPAES